jgi:hypothetical protein
VEKPKGELPSSLIKKSSAEKELKKKKKQSMVSTAVSLLPGKGKDSNSLESSTPKSDHMPTLTTGEISIPYQAAATGATTASDKSTLAKTIQHNVEDKDDKSTVSNPQEQDSKTTTMKDLTTKTEKQ